MAIEKFDNRKLHGPIRITCKFENAPTRIWETDKETVIERIQYIVDRYSEQGYVLTLRQLHYQFVTRNWIVNHDSAYKKLGDILDDCRYGGLIDWEAIEDRGRVPFIPYYVNDVDHALQDTIEQYRLDRMKDQDVAIEMWTEKDALSGILKRVTRKYHVRLVVNKGYTSSSAIYGAYKRVIGHMMAGRKVRILYFGDHDPSGLDMVRDIRERLLTMISNGDHQSDLWDQSAIWSTTKEGKKELKNPIYSDLEDDLSEDAKSWIVFVNTYFRIDHIGLTKEQIDEYDLPPNPTKLTDSRSDGYIRKHGKTCWEVDALEPQVLTQLVEDSITSYIDVNKWASIVQQEQVDIKTLESFIGKRKKK